MSVSTDEERPMGRSARKRQAIMEAALAAFLDKGYGRTSMDEIAAAAEVSKQTVYKNFTSKERMFTEIVIGAISAAEASSKGLVESLSESEDLRVDLRRFARKHLDVVLQPHLVQMRRIIVAEAMQFPDLARTWYEQGPQLGHLNLGREFSQLAERGLLRFDDAEQTAAYFNWLILSIPLNHAMFIAGAPPPSEKELERYAEEGVRIFLAAFGASPDERSDT